MTLVQVLVDEMSLHMSCDFRLTDPVSRKVCQDDAHKLIGVTGPHVFANVGVTGLGELEGKPIGVWIAESLSAGGTGSSLAEVLAKLAELAHGPLSGVRDTALRRHTFVVGAMVGTQAVVSLVSNFEAFEGGRIIRKPTADATLTISSLRPKGPQLLTFGAVGSVTAEHGSRLTTLLRAKAADGPIQEALSESNLSASLIDTTVSAGCYVASMHAEGRGSARGFLTDAQSGDFVPPEFEAMLRRMGAQIGRKIGPDGKPLPIRMVGSTSVQMGGNETWFKEHLRLEPNSAELWNNYGVLLSSHGRIDEAEEKFRRALDLDPEYVTAIGNLAGLCWVDRHDADEAGRLYREAVRLSEPQTPASILSVYAGFCDDAFGDPVLARELHEKAAAESGFPLAKARFASFLLQHGDDAELAARLTAEALESQPTNPEILFYAGHDAWFYEGDEARAAELLHRACSMSPEQAYIYRTAADVSLLRGETASACYYYRKALKRRATGWDLHCNYALALLLERKVDGAVRQLDRAVKLNPGEPVVIINRAAAQWAARLRQGAVASIRDLLEAGVEPALELEALAILHVSLSESQGEASRLRELVASGIRVDGLTLRAMIAFGDENERKRGRRYARLIETGEE